MKLRVLVTGSLNWHHYDSVATDLLTLLRYEDVAVLTVVHGGERSGVDQAAREFCETWRPWTPFLARDLVEERVEAQWMTHGIVAGAMRDKEMVARGADICLAYPLGHPSTPAMDAAELAGIEVWNRS